MDAMPVPSTEELEQMLLHQRIRNVRDGLPMSQQKFALAVGVSERQVKRWESGTNLPTEENGRRIAELADRPAELFIPRAEGLVRLPADVLAEMADRLRALEEQVSESIALTRRALELLELPVAPPTSAAPPTRKRANG